MVRSESFPKKERYCIFCKTFHSSLLTLSRLRSILYRNQSIDLDSKSMNWFLYDKNLRHKRVNRRPLNDCSGRLLLRFYYEKYPQFRSEFNFKKISALSQLRYFHQTRSLRIFRQVNKNHLESVKNQHYTMECLANYTIPSLLKGID